MQYSPEELASKISRIIDDKKGNDIKILDVRNLSSIADYFIIATGNSTKHTTALADEVEKKLNEVKVFINHKEGYNDGKWILLDYIDVIVHIFTEEERNFYDLERIWKDAKYIELNIDTM